MAEVVTFPGIERRDLTPFVDPREVLAGAMESGVADVIIVGRKPNGEFYLACSDGNMDAVAGKLLYAATWLSSREVEHHP